MYLYDIYGGETPEGNAATMVRERESESHRSDRM